MDEDRAEIERVNRLLASYLGQASVDVAAAPVCIRAGSAAVYVRLLDVAPRAVRVFSPMLRGVDCSAELLAELNRINGSVNTVRVFWRSGTVYASVEHLTETLDHNELEYACELVAAVADHHDHDLQATFGGSLSFDDAPGTQRSEP